jgi:hypothetical protein
MIVAVTKIGQMANQILMVTFLLLFSSATDARTAYEIQAVDNDGRFIINDKKFKAKTFCQGWGKGEKVVFIEGSENGVCQTAKLYNLFRKETCVVYCE